MCMHLKSKEIDLKHGKIDKDGYLVGYKVLRASKDSICYSYDWEIGLNVSSRTKKSRTKYEKRDYVIYQGFHILLSKSSAKLFIKDFKDSLGDDNGHIIKVFYKPKDVVSYGYTNVVTPKQKLLKTVVVTKCTVKSLKGV